MLVRDGASLDRARAVDPEGFSAGAHQFDSDITGGPLSARSARARRDAS